jgi:hypothetical protein
MFMGTFTAPAAPALCDLQFQMTHNGVPFGPLAVATIDVQEANNNAIFPNHTIPSAMEPDQGLWVGVTTRNTGNTQWNPALHQLAVLQDTCNLLGASVIPLDALVNPSKSNVFYLYLTAPAAPATCDLQLRMEEISAGPIRAAAGAGLFGDLFNVAIQIAEPPNAVRDWTVYE